jgi:hypothetical protein
MVYPKATHNVGNRRVKPADNFKDTVAMISAAMAPVR